MSFKFQNKSCLIVIDIQNSYKDKIFDYEDFRKNIIKLLRKARKENIPICFVFEIDNENSHWIPFWEEMKGPRELDKGIPLKFCKPKENDFVFFKNGYDSFFETGLNNFLKDKGFETLYVCGVLTGVCVLNTVFSAFNNGFRIHLLENCCSDIKKTRHNFVLNNYSNYLFIKDSI